MTIVLIPVGLFIVSLILFHFFAITCRWSRRTWLVIEYFWLGIAVISVIVLTVEIQKLIAQNELLVERSQLESSRKNLVSQASEFADSYETGGLFAWKAEQQEKGRWYQDFSKWCRRILVATEQFNVNELNSLSNASPPVSNDMRDLDQERKILLRSIKHVLEQARITAETEGRSKGWPLTGYLLGLSIFLVPLALSLPITKVTADLMGRIS